MKLTICAATGRIGRQILEQALNHMTWSNPPSRIQGRRIVAAIAASIMVLSGMGSAHASTGQQPAGEAEAVDKGDKIKPKLKKKLESTGEAEFWVRFNDDADLREAAESADWAQRGAGVVQALRETAEASQADTRAQLDAEGVAYDAFWATNAIYVHAGTMEMAQALAAHPEVESLDPTTTYEIPEPEEGELVPTLTSGVEWGIANIRANDVWDEYGVRGAGITVANIDTGVQYSHPALVGQYRGNLGNGSFDHDYNWFDASGRCPSAPCDSDGHGTHTMGTMVGDDGAANKIGVAPEVEWIAANGCCPNDAALVASGQWMLAPTDLEGQNPDAGRRPHVINNSWGSQIVTSDPFMEDISLAWAASGIFAIWSNGNLGPACRTSSSPGSRIVNYSVGAYAEDEGIADFSSRGSGQGGEIKPNISAPGVNVRSAVPGNGYFSAQGTSMAAPHVAGAIALLWSAAPALIGDVDGTWARLDGTATDSPDSSCGGTATDNNVFGEGRLDALTLVDSAEIQDTGTLAITVTDARTREPIAGAEVAIAGLVGRERVTREDGTYSLPLPPGEYQVTVSAFGYEDQAAGATITTGETTSQEYALEALPTVTVRGQATDGSGHGWPLYADITVDGVPGGRFHTRPTNGRYSFTLPADGTYTVTTRSRYGGYEVVTEPLVVGDRNVVRDIVVPVDAEECAAAGYAYGYDGFSEDFDAGSPADWSVIDHLGSGNVWRFDDPFNRGNLTGGSGAFAIAQSPGGVGGELDSSLVSPVVDLTGHDEPIFRFRQDFVRLLDVARVELSIDGGATWETLLEQTSNVRGPREEVIPIPQAANQPDVQVRFHLSNSRFNSRFWQIDDVFVGTRTCDPLPGGLVLGHVRDHNTGEAVNGATVTDDDEPQNSSQSVATSDDPDLDDGFWWMFSSHTGTRSYTATADSYAAHHRNVSLEPSRVSEQDFRLPAGQLTVEPDDLTASVRAGRTTKVTFTVTNNGSAPARVEFRERDGVYDIPREQTATPAGFGAEVVRIPGEFSPLASGGSDHLDEDAGTQTGRSATASSPWIDLPAYPTHVMDNAVGELDGRIYSVAGRDETTTLSQGYVYDPGERSWAPIADLPALRQAAAGAVIDGRFYVAGGWGVGFPEGQGTRSTYVYDPETDVWDARADAPFIFAAAGRAVLDGQLYIVGGCTNSCTLSRVHRYDPASDSWEALAPYPVSTSHLACGGIAGQVWCAGGTRAGGVVWNRTYAYDPETNAWARKADMPIQLWGMSYTVSSERLLVSAGITGGAIDFSSPSQPTAMTNEGFIYDPVTDAWSRLPASHNPLYRSGSTCGLTRVGGTMVRGFVPTDTVDLLPTYGDCVPVDVPWLSLDMSSVTVAPGKKAKVTVTLAAADLEPGTYAGGVWVKQATPYLTYPVSIDLNVTATG